MQISEKFTETLNKLWNYQDDVDTSHLTLAMVYAQCANGGIGLANSLPWKVKADMKLFWKLVGGCPVIVGHKTFQGIQKYLSKHDCYHAVIDRKSEISSFEKAVSHLSRKSRLEHAPSKQYAWVVGGAKTYIEALPKCKVVVATHIHELYNCDSFLPWIGTPEGFVFYDAYELPKRDDEPYSTVNIYIKKEYLSSAESYLQELGIRQALHSFDPHQITS